MSESLDDDFPLPSKSGPLVPLEAQIACAERELKYRIRVYGRWCDEGRMARDKANHELAAMRAILDTLQQVNRGERLI